MDISSDISSVSPRFDPLRSMTVRTKVVVLLALLFTLMIVVEIAIQQIVLLPSFADLEQNAALTSMTRIRLALDRNLESLQLNDQEWSNWGELYQFMQDQNPAFIATYTTAEAMTPLKANVLMLVDRDGRVVFSAARALDSGAPLDLDFAAAHVLPEHFPWRQNLAQGKPARGIIRTNQGIMLLAGAPIFNGSGGGRCLGMTLMGRLLTAEELQLIGTEAQAAVSLREVTDDNRFQRLVESDKVTQVFRSFDDLYGRPVMVLSIDLPRAITLRGHLAVTYSSLYLFGSAIVILGLLFVVLDRVALKRIERVTRHAVAVGEGADVSARLNSDGTDEIDQLSREFDRMVVRVDETRRQLVDQSFRAGRADMAKGVLHNLGNAMTPFSVRLAAVTERLQSLPLADVKAAATELKADAVPADRAQDLIEFVKLGSEEIEGALRAADAAAAAMEQQTDVVKRILVDHLAAP